MPLTRAADDARPRRIDFVSLPAGSRPGDTPEPLAKALPATPASHLEAPAAVHLGQHFELTASLLMGLGAACMFVFAVKRNYFRDLEDTKYQVFWSDLEELVEHSKETDRNGCPSQSQQ